MTTSPRPEAVAELLASRREEVLGRWLAMARAQPFHRARPADTVADSIPPLFEAVVDLLRRPASRELEAGSPLRDPAVLAAARAHAAVRYGQGLDASAIMAEFRLLREEMGRALLRPPADRVGTADVAAAQRVLCEALDGAVLLEALGRDRVQSTEQPGAESKDLLHLLVERVEEYAMFLLDPEGGVASWNAGAERIKGYATQEIIGRPYRTFFTEEDRAAGKPERLLRRARVDGRVEDEGWRVRKDGSRFWADALLTALFGDQGQLLGYAKVTRDLTAQREAEAQRLLGTALRELVEARDRALAEAEAERRRLHDLFMQAPALIAVLRGSEHVFELANPPFLQATGRRDASGLVGKPAREALPELAGQGYFELLDRVYRTGDPVVASEALIKVDRRGDGRLEDVYANIVYQPTRDAAGDVDGILMHAVDVTGQVRARQRTEELAAALAEERERFAAIFDQATAGIAQTDLSGRFELVNDRFCEVLGRPREELLGLRVEDVTHPDDRPSNLANSERMLTTGEAFTMEKRYLRPDGGTVWVRNAVSLVRDANGAPRHMLAVADDVTDRKRAEAALRLRSDLIEAAHDAIFAWAAHDGITLWNRGAQELYGYTAEEALGRRSHDLLGTPPEHVAALTAGLEHSGRWEGELVHTTRDGRQVVVEARLVQVHADNRPYVLEATRNVTEQRRGERALRASEARWAFLAEAGRVLGSSIDYETTLANMARLAVPHVADWCAVDLLDQGGGLPRLAVAHVDPAKVQLAHDLQRRYPPDPNDTAGPAHVVRTGEPELVADIPDELVKRSARDPEHLALLRGLGLRSYMAVPVRVREQTLGAISFVAAESGRRFGPEDLAMAEELARRAAVAIDNARLFAQQEEARAAAERAAERTRRLQEITSQLSRSLEAEEVLGTIASSAAELIGAPVGAVFLLEAPDADFVLAAAHGVEPSQAEALRLPRNTSLAGRAVDQRRTLVVDDVRETPGTALPELLTGQTIGSEMAAPIMAGAESLGVVKVFSPTLRRFSPDDAELLGALAAAAAVALSNARLYREAQQAIRVRDDFLAAASHDLKNPLASVRGNAQLLLRTMERRGAVPPDRLTHALTSMVGSTDRMVDQIDELLDVARLRLGEPLPLDRAPTDLVALARRAVAAQQAATERHQIHLRAAEANVVGEWDAARLERVLGNLLSNAVKYSPNGGEIAVAVWREQDQAVLSVRDEGVGIPAEDLPRVFKRFERARNVAGRIGGSGIGLAASQQTVEQHGGTITVESREGEGSTFIVHLPLASGGSRSSEKA